MSYTTIGASQLECALAEACRRAHADVLAFTVAPRRCSVGEPWDGHDWLIEFADPPRAPGLFPRALDEALCRLHAEYRAARLVDGVMAPPRVIELPAGTFHRWRHHVPRVHADRAVADGLLAVAGAGPVPLIAVGS
jgi:hypothetical protein